MKLSILALITLLFAQSQAPKSVIEGRVLRANTHDPISDVLVTLVAPVTANSTANLSPVASARLSDQIASLTESGNRAGASQQVIDNAIENARRNAGAAGAPMSVMTDVSGHFAFRDLAPGRYTVRAEREGYFATPLNGSASNTVTKAITIEEGKTPPSSDLLMVKGAVISGRVRDPNGQPMSGMNVAVFRVNYNNGRKVWTTVNSKSTDDLGEFRIFWITPGEYFVGAVPRAPGATPGPQDAWSKTLFPGVAEPAAATAIVIRDGGDAPGTDIQILAGNSGAFKISGVVINSAAKPNPTTGVVDRSISNFILVPKDPGLLDSNTTVQNALPTAARANGEFEIRNVRSGSYDLYPIAPAISDPAPPAATAAPGQTVIGTVGATIQMIDGNLITTGSAAINRRQPTSRTPIDVSRDISDLRIVVNSGVTLSGEVVVSGSAPSIKPESIRLNLRALDTLPTNMTSLIGTIPVDASAKFSIPNVPEARYTFQISGLPVTAYVADIRQGGTSVMDNGFVLDASAAPLQVVIEPSGGTVQGTVLNASGKPAASATVALVPPTSRRQNPVSYRNVTTNDKGEFTLRGVPPGPYTIFAWENVLSTAWMNADYLAKYESHGRPLTVTSSTMSDLQVSLIPFE